MDGRVEDAGAFAAECASGFAWRDFDGHVCVHEEYAGPHCALGKTEHAAHRAAVVLKLWLEAVRPQRPGRRGFGLEIKNLGTGWHAVFSRDDDAIDLGDDHGIGGSVGARVACDEAEFAVCGEVVGVQSKGADGFREGVPEVRGLERFEELGCPAGDGGRDGAGVGREVRADD